MQERIAHSGGMFNPEPSRVQVSGFREAGRNKGMRPDFSRSKSKTGPVSISIPMTA
jgi:hypothetical protein